MYLLDGTSPRRSLEDGGVFLRQLLQQVMGLLQTRRGEACFPRGGVTRLFLTIMSECVLLIWKLRRKIVDQDKS